MALIESVCPKCDSKIPVDDSCKKLFCMYCGERFIVSELTENMGKLVLVESRDPAAELDPEAILLTGPNTNGRVAVYADGKLLGKLRMEETVVTDLKPGTYTFYARIGIEGAPKTVLELGPGDRIRVEHMGLKGFRVIKE